jgi:large subunit ribosomal protein L17
MRHQKRGRKFGRVRKQRRALLKTMLGSLIMKEKIKTTEAKAKELKSKVDKIINRAKKSKVKERKLSIIRELKKEIPDIAISKLMGEFLEKFDKRVGGYARVVKLEKRKSDGAEMAIIEFV